MKANIFCRGVHFIVESRVVVGLWSHGSYIAREALILGFRDINPHSIKSFTRLLTMASVLRSIRYKTSQKDKVIREASAPRFWCMKQGGREP